MGILRGLLIGFGGSVKLSRASKRVGPLYQGMLVDFLIRFSPVHPETGMICTFLMSYPTIFRRFSTSCFDSLNLCSEYFTVWSSILFMHTTSWLTPKVLSRNACSLACPPGPRATSCSPFLADTIRTEASASEAPE